MSNFIYLSPHLDDAVFSCGGVIWDQISQNHTVNIWTIFAGDPPDGELTPLAREIHQRWLTGDDAPAVRRGEDALACERLQAVPQHFNYPDCIYRKVPATNQPLIEKNEELFQPLPASQQLLVAEITRHLQSVLRADCTLIVPLSIGSHIDHQIVRRVGENLNRQILYFADFPYASQQDQQLTASLPEKAAAIHFPLTEQTLAVWQYAVEAYTSQISTFWQSLTEMRQSIKNYAKSPFGNCLWTAAGEENLLSRPEQE